MPNAKLYRDVTGRVGATITTTAPAATLTRQPTGRVSGAIVATEQGT